MDTASVLTEIVQNVACDFDVKLTAETDLRYDLCFDSLDMIDLLIDIEDEFQIEIEDAAFSKVKTFGDLVQIVQEAE